MAADSYDIIIGGGGLGGSALAKSMAEHGASVLLLERTIQFKDRVRGETMHPWGVSEAKELGIFDLLEETCGHHLPWWDNYVEGEHVRRRDMVATTPHGAPEYSFYHPAMQEVLLQAAMDAGAEVHRAATATAIRTNGSRTVAVRENGNASEYIARLIVGADGRNSQLRTAAGFTIQRDADRRFVSGMYFKTMPAPESSSSIHAVPGCGKSALLFPQGDGRVRVYIVQAAEVASRLQGNGDVPGFVRELTDLGVPKDILDKSTHAGPLATFGGADAWVEHPYDNRVALIGDAAATTDPSFGCGISLTLRDVRVLRDHLLSNTDWETAGHAYAEEHRRYYSILHTVTDWFGQMLFETGPAADAIRERARPLHAEDPSRVPDHIFAGPDEPVDETARRRFFGEE
jgi:2-polyprenyl-6-methoxyphenol hydroxylase-like FAD-dependent oxidoreductase